ncbi:MAG: hypothetical protein ICV84_07070 [Flavisolibacter sp.]|nr:hypothetical protein [Flavisolibacter sp.]
MSLAKPLDKEINQYLPLLSDRQKKAVLTVVKTFAEEGGMVEYSEEFKKELDSRYEEYKNGGKVISEAEVKRRIKQIINGKIKK